MNDLYLYRDVYHRSSTEDLTRQSLALLPELLRLADLRTKGGDAMSFAEELLTCLRLHPPFAAVDRVCLAQLAPGCPLLKVLGSANSPRARTNQVSGGYHCFIADNGSLTRVREGRLRQYRDTREVLASFGKAGVPPQRTIRLIADMGHRAGLVLPLEQGASTGHLFLNSVEPGAFDQLDLDALAALGLVTQFARVYLHPLPTTASVLRWPARPLDWRALQASLAGAVGQRFGARVDLRHDDDPVIRDGALLWCPDAVVRAICDGIAVLVGGDAKTVRLQVSLHNAMSDQAVIRLRSPGQALIVSTADLVPLAFALAPWGIHPLVLPQGGLDLVVPADLAFHADERGCYSI